MDAHGKETLTVFIPHDESIVVSGVQVANAEDVDEAVNAADAAFRGPWGSFSGQQRAACMFKLAELLEKNRNRLAHLETIAMGCPKILATPLLNTAAEIWRCKYQRL